MRKSTRIYITLCAAVVVTGLVFWVKSIRREYDFRAFRETVRLLGSISLDVTEHDVDNAVRLFGNDPAFQSICLSSFGANSSNEELAGWMTFLSRFEQQTSSRFVSHDYLLELYQLSKGRRAFLVGDWIGLVFTMPCDWFPSVTRAVAIDSQPDEYDIIFMARAIELRAIGECDAVQIKESLQILDSKSQEWPQAQAAVGIAALKHNAEAVDEAAERLNKLLSRNAAGLKLVEKYIAEIKRRRE